MKEAPTRTGVAERTRSAKKRADRLSRPAAPRSAADGCCPERRDRWPPGSDEDTCAGVRDADSAQDRSARGDQHPGRSNLCCSTAVAHGGAWFALLPRDGCRSFPDLLFRTWDGRSQRLPPLRGGQARGSRARSPRPRPARPPGGRPRPQSPLGCQRSWSAVPPSSSSSSVSRKRATPCPGVSARLRPNAVTGTGTTPACRAPGRSARKLSWPPRPSREGLDRTRSKQRCS